MSNTSSPGSLGNLAQSARSGQLRTARIIMFIVGGLNVLLNLFAFGMAKQEIDQVLQNEVNQAQAQGMVIDPDELEAVRSQAVSTARIFSGLGVILGVVFVVLGIFVYQIPVAATVLALVLYVGSYAVAGFLDPSLLYKGLIIKILIVVGLFKSIQAAIAYKNERG